MTPSPIYNHHAAAARGMRFTTVAACLMLALSGCASVAPQRAAPVAVYVPANWSASDHSAMTDAPSLAQWWLRFNDPLLASLVAQALQANTSVKSAEAALRQARALRDVSAAGLLPAVGSSARRSAASAVATPPATPSRSASMRTGSSTSSAPTGRAGRQPRPTPRPAPRAWATCKCRLPPRWRSATSRCGAPRLRLAIAADNLASQLETLQITHWRLQAGLVTSLETDQARTTAEQTRARIPALQTAIEQARHALAVLTGQPPADLSTVLAASGPVPQAAADLALSIPAETLRQRPDVRAAEYQVTAALARVSQAEAARYAELQAGWFAGSVRPDAGRVDQQFGGHRCAAGQRVAAGVRWRRPARPGACAAGRAGPGGHRLTRLPC